MQIRLAQLDEYTNIANFIDQFWKKDHIYVRSQELFDWTFQKSPEWDAQSYSVSLAIDNDVIVGMLGVIPFELNVYGYAYKACWLVNWFMHPDARKGRAGLDLLNFFVRKYHYDTVSFGINDRIAELYKALRWELMPHIPRMEWVNPEYSYLARSLVMQANLSASHEDIDDVVNRRLLDMQPIISNDAISLEQVNGNVWDTTGWEFWKSRVVGCARNFRYLRWRYLQHPLYTYDSCLIPEGEQLGLIVWRMEKVNLTGLNGNLEGDFLFCRIVEFLPVSENNAQRLMARLLENTKRLSLVAADFYCYNVEIQSILVKLGFFVSTEAGMSLPNFTQPIAAGASIRSAIKIKSFNNANVFSSEKFYWTRSDSDQDRPN